MLELTIGYMAVILTALSFIPQVAKTIKSRSVNDLSLFTLIIFVCASTSWLVYGFLKTDYPIIITNTLTFSLQLILLILKIRYQKSARVIQ